MPTMCMNIKILKEEVRLVLKRYKEKLVSQIYVAIKLYLIYLQCLINLKSKARYKN
jgi:hypothetical protein